VDWQAGKVTSTWEKGKGVLMITKRPEVINRELEEAEANVREAEAALDEAEAALTALVQKYKLCWGARDVSDLLPTMAYIAGLRLSATEHEMYLKDKDGNDLASWCGSPSLTELFDTCNKYLR
jgi:hypothetical protein